MEPDIRLHPEMEVVGPLYAALIAAGVDAHLEVRAPAGDGFSYIRIDIGVFSGPSLIAAIECKRKGARLHPDSRQARCYDRLWRDHGVRLFFVNDEASAAEAVEALRGAA